MDKINLKLESIIGETKGTPLERVVKQNFNGEVSEAGIYVAMARQAQREGYPEIAEVLKSIAWDEVEHASRFAELNGMIQDTLVANIKQMLEGEIFANEGKVQAGEQAKTLGIEAAYHYFYESAKDEARHGRMLEGILKRYNL